MKKVIKGILEAELSVNNTDDPFIVCLLEGVGEATDKIAKYIEDNYKPIIPGTDRKYTYREFTECLYKWNATKQAVLDGWKAYKKGDSLEYFTSLHSKIGCSLNIIDTKGIKCSNHIPYVEITAFN